MKAILVGLVFILFGVYAVLPFDWSLNWGSQVIAVLQGATPLIAGVIGLLALLIGFADIKDKAEEKKEAQKAKEESKA